MRMPNLNLVVITGRCTRDPELKYTKNKVAMLRFSIASNHYHMDTTGDWKTDVTFVNVICWQKLAERGFEKLKKGSPVCITGRLESSTWETQEGTKRSAVSMRADRIQFLEKVKDEEDDSQLSLEETEETDVEPF